MSKLDVPYWLGSTVKETVHILAEENGKARVIAGGTAPQDGNLPVYLAHRLSNWFRENPDRHLLCVVPISKDGNTTYKISQSYSLDRNDKAIDAWSLDWPAYLVLFAYLFWAKLRKPGTLGDRAAKISVVDDSLKTSLPPPVKQMAIRYAALLGPFLVTTAIILTLAKLFGSSTEDMAKYHYLAVAFVIMAPALVYYFVCFVQIVRKTDPYWDRWAMTAVIRSIRP